MKKFKEIDVYMNVLIFIVTLMAIPVSLETAFCIFYFGLGAWQLLSMLAHVLFGDTCHLSNKRTAYHIVVLALFLLVGMSLIFTPLAYILALVMLIAGPIMAVFYFNMCYKETYLYNVRPLAVIK